MGKFKEWYKGHKVSFWVGLLVYIIVTIICVGFFISSESNKVETEGVEVKETEIGVIETIESSNEEDNE